MKIIIGNNVPDLPHLAVIVMAVDSDLRALEAIDSIKDEGIERIIVNSGEGSLADSIDRDDVSLIEFSSKLMPGGTRNAGITHSKAPIVSFLAADCLVAPGSLQKRVSAHNAGYHLVSSALRPMSNSIPSWACYAYNHQKRMPEYNKGKGSFFGVSYGREVFEECGLFNEEMRIAEDAEFNDRCENLRSLLASDILTYHRYPETFSAALEDSGRRALIQKKHRGRSGVRQAKSEISKTIRLFFKALLSPRSPWMLRRASAMILIIGFYAAYKCLLPLGSKEAE